MTPFETLVVVVVGGWLLVWAINRLYSRALRADLRDFATGRCMELYRGSRGLHQCRLPDGHVGRHLYDLMHADPDAVTR